ncbi:MAG: 50S ribosomal protein L13 [Thermodesulfovibrionia bacterium]|nr:50S ribosomal protein L13 [Thermodesulfovibrionia bacterium]
MKTVFTKKSDVDTKWYVVDADGQVLGRLASRVASVLRGKTKPIYTPNADTGDGVIIINAGKIQLTGNKLVQKVYYHHTGYPGGIKKETAKDLIKLNPEKLLTTAIRGMLPKNTLGREQIKKLKVYSGTDHPHVAQNPEPLTLTK